jgi:hypothetical protein
MRKSMGKLKNMETTKYLMFKLRDEFFRLNSHPAFLLIFRRIVRIANSREFDLWIISFWCG